MNRDEQLGALTDSSRHWDMIIIGGGATGLGAALDAASRGYRTLLLEKGDFAVGTSSRSTKLVHGGVRYLKQGNVRLVLEALKERGLLVQNAPHLVHKLGFIVPSYHWWDTPFYGLGLKVYDLLAGKLGLGPSQILSREETLKQIPTVNSENLRGGTLYYDGQFDDARLAITIAQTAIDKGATLINYMSVTDLVKESNKVAGVIARDLESDSEFHLTATVVINATGVFTDTIRALDNPDTKKIIVPSQGAHIVLDQSFLPGQTAIMVPKTDDGRVLFAIPWHNRTLLGTTDTPVDSIEETPKSFEEEINYLISHAARYLTRAPKRSDVLSTFAGLRPLVKTAGSGETSAVPRDHTVLVSKSGLVTVTGGKWTTYRRMAEDTINQAANVGSLPIHPVQTETLRLHGWTDEPMPGDQLAPYGSDRTKLVSLAEENPSWTDPIHPNLPYQTVEIIWAIRNEMARTIDDLLSRRTRSLLLNAPATIEIAPRIADLLATELQRDDDWKRKQLTNFMNLAESHLIAA